MVLLQQSFIDDYFDHAKLKILFNSMLHCRIHIKGNVQLMVMLARVPYNQDL